MAGGMIIRVRVCEGGSICYFFFYVNCIFPSMTWLHISKTSLEHIIIYGVISIGCVVYSCWPHT